MEYEHLKTIICAVASYNLLAIYVFSLIYFRTYTPYDIYMFIELFSPNVNSWLILSLTWKTYSIATLALIPIGVFIGLLAYWSRTSRFKSSNDILRYHLYVLLIFIATSIIPFYLYLLIEGYQIINPFQNLEILFHIVVGSGWYGFVGWIIWLVTRYIIDLFYENIVIKLTAS